METSSTTGLWSEELTRRTEEQRQQRQQPLRHPPSYLYHSHAKEEEEEEEEEEHDRENEEEVEEEEEQSYYMQEEGEEEMETTTELLTQTFTSTLSISGERRKQAEQEQDEEEAYIEEVEEEEEDGSALVMELQQLEQERQHEEQEQQQQQRQQQQQQQQQQRSINKTFMVVEERRRAASFSFSAAPPLDFLDEVYIAGSASAAAASSSSSLSQRSAPQMHPKNNDEGGEEVMPTWQVLRCYQQLREEISRLQAEKMTLESAVARQKRYEATLSNENNSKNKVGGTESSRKRRLQRSYDLLDDAEKRLLEMEAALVQRRVRMLRLVKELSKRRAAEGSENASGNGGRRRRERNRHGRSRSGSRCYRREPQAQAQTQPLPQIQLTLPLPTSSSSSDVTTTSSFSPRFAIQQQTILSNNTNQSLSSSLEEEDPYFSVTASSSPSSPFSSSSCFSSLTPPTKSRLDLRRASIHIQVQSKKRTETESESEDVMATTPTTRERRTRSLVQEPLPRILPVEVADPTDPFPRCFQEEAEDRRADLILQRILQDVQKAEEEEDDEEEEAEEDAIDEDEEDSDEDADEEDDDEQGRERNYITRVKLKAHNGGFRNGSKKQKNREAKKQELVGYSDSLRKDQRCNNFLLLEAEVLQEIADIRVNSNELELLRVVGKGAYGEVFLARWKNQDVAVKRLSLQAKDPKLQVEHRKQVLRAFRREVACLRRASNHPNIVKVYGAYITEQYCGIVMEYMSGGSLHDVLHLHKTAFSLRRSLQLAKDVAEGMRYIHSLNVIHRDVTTHNLLFHPQDANRGQLFVGDFGIAIFKQKRTVITTSGNKKRLPMSPVGHPRYRAPEITRNELYSKRADVYTFGTVLYELFVRVSSYSFPHSPLFLLLCLLCFSSLHSSLLFIALLFSFFFSVWPFVSRR
ncbi:protein kinase, variant 2 [Balamuthia mandrillaris]